MSVNLQSPDFGAFFHHIPAPYLILATDTPHFTIIGANDAFLKATNKNREEIIGQSVFIAFPNNPDDPTADGVTNLSASLTQVLNTGETHAMDMQRHDITNRDGAFETRYWLLCNSPIFDDNGQMAAIAHNVINVTNQQQVTAEAEKARLLARKSEDARLASEAFNQYLQDVIDIAQTGIFVFTPVYNQDGSVTDFRFRLANKMLSAYVGQVSERVTGGLGSDWFPDYITNGLFDKYYHTWSTGENTHFEFHYDGSGIDVWLDIMCTKLPDGDILITFSDHTALRQLQSRLEHSVEELSRSNQYLEQFAYIASHDMQEPLRKIRAFGDLLISRHAAQLDDAGRDMLGRMNSAAHRMQVLIEDMLIYSRVSTRPKEFQTVDLEEVLIEVCSDLETTIQEKDAVITAKGLAYVKGDSVQLGQMFLNLLSNAIKFARPEVPPRIEIVGETVTGKDAGFQSGSSEARQSFLKIQVQDNGIGFEQQYAERIFGMFQRLQGRSEIPGTGIGLSIVQKVITNHDGRIIARSKPGEGALFIVWLPLA